jgi:filamentous hemagglutinin
MFGASTKSFEVPRWLLEQLRAEARAEALSGQFPNAPLRVDETKAPNQFGLRPAQVEKLRGAIVPGSGKQR